MLRMLIDQKANNKSQWEPLGKLICDFVNYRKIDGCAKNGIHNPDMKKGGINGQDLHMS